MMRQKQVSSSKGVVTRAGLLALALTIVVGVTLFAVLNGESSSPTKKLAGAADSQSGNASQTYRPWEIPGYQNPEKQLNPEKQPAKPQLAAKVAAKLTDAVTTASSTATDSTPRGAIDGERFGIQATNLWQGKADEKSWWWQITFSKPRSVGAILQIVGDHPYGLRNAPLGYVWQASTDGKTWEDIKETAISNERRIYRVHRFEKILNVLAMRLTIESATGTFPTLREVECFDDTKAEIPFSPWAVVVSSTGEKQVPGEGKQFVPLMKSCDSTLQAQNVWLGDFNEEFLAVEPRPLCGFMSGNFIDWCQQNREHWRGTLEVLQKKNLPIWASCGGMQGLAIISEVGVDKPWDCPHCRDAKNPHLPIYTHLPGSTQTECGKYKECVFERGPFNIKQLTDDPVFAGLPNEFQAMESHCGQIEWPPEGWMLIATKGEGTTTKTQTIRLKDRYVYASQYHIEMNGTPENSRTIMANFLKLATEWGGYNPKGKAVAEPKLLKE